MKLILSALCSLLFAACHTPPPRPPMAGTTTWMPNAANTFELFPSAKAMETYIEEIRAALPTTTDRAPDGKFITPNCPRCGAPPIDIWTGYHCDNGGQYETKNSKPRP